MYRLFPGKTPTQMRREAERAAGVTPPKATGAGRSRPVPAARVRA